MVDLFESIVVPVPRERIMKRLGYRPGMTRLTAQGAIETDTYIEEAVALICLRAAARRMRIMERPEGAVVLEGGDVLRSHRVAALLAGCTEVLLMGATAGYKIVAAVGRAAADNNLARAVVYDATASEIVDAALDWLADYYRRAVRRENRTVLTRRFSAGYGDFSIAAQQQFFRLLELERLGITISPLHILAPEKSVTALTGIG